MKKLKQASKWLRNKKRSHLVGASIFMAVFALVGVAFLLRSFAAGERLYLTPATASVQTGTDVTVTLRINGGAGMNAIDALVNYDQTKLQFKSIDDTASGFGTAFISENTPGQVHIARFVTGSTVITTDVELAKITFTAIATTSGPATLSVSGQATDGGSTIALEYGNSTINITAPTTPTRSASFTIEPTVASPLVGSQLGLRVYTTSDAVFQGGEVTVNLPAGLSYTGTLDTAGGAFNPATTVTGTTAQTVNLVFVTQSTTLTGKQLIATIPVNATTAGAKQVTFTGARLVDLNDTDITPVTANPFNLTVNNATLPAPVVTRPGRTQLATTENITDLRQAFTITNFDNTATYTVTLGGQNLTLSSSGFSIPANTRNADLSLQVSVAKNGATGSASYTIRLRSPNVNRNACVELLDLLAVNGGYGGASTELDLNFDGTVSLVDLLTVTGNWGSACI